MTIEPVYDPEASNSWVFGVGNDWDRKVARTLGPSQTMIDQYLATAGDTYWVQRQNTTTPVAGTTVAINDMAPTNDRWNLAAVEVIPAGPADTQAPSAPTDLVATAPAANQVTLTWTASTDNVGVAGYTVFRDGAEIGTTATSSFTDNSVSPNTTYGYSVTAYDTAGNNSTPSNTANVTTPADTTAPTVLVTAPSSGATVMGVTTLSATASDNIGVTSVQFQVDGTNVGAADTAPPYSASWDSAIATDGSHSVDAVAYDAAGNSTTSSVVNFTVNNAPDTQPPTVSITAPSNGATVSGSIGITASASDNVGVAGVQFKLDGANLGAEDAAAPYSVSWNTGSASNGSHSLTALARDAAGNSTTSSVVTVTVNNTNGVAVTINGSATQQNIDGFGVNAIPKTWQGGALKPALDALIAAGATAWRVDVDNAHSDWEYNNDDADPFNFNWNYYDSLYGGPQFSDLWDELSYLNNKGVSNIEMSMSGLVPNWMSTGGNGSTISSSKEDEFVEQTVSLLLYARNVKGIRFTSISPLNETDKTSTEGPTVGATQFAQIMGKLATRLDQVGLSDVQIIGPHTTSFETAYTDALLGNAAAMSHIKAFSYHSYGTSANAPSSAGYALSNLQASAYPNSEVYVGEWNQCYTDGCPEGTEVVSNEWSFAREMTDELLNHLDAGASEVQAWDAWNSWHEHDNCCSYSAWGELTQDNNGVWNVKKRLYSNEQVFRFVSPGMRMVSSSVPGSSNLDFDAFKNQATGQITIVGHNRGSSAQTLQISMSGMPSVSSLAYYQTNATDNVTQGADVAVNNGALSVQVPADTIFTLSNVTSPFDSTKSGPAISNVVANQISSTSTTISWTTDRPSTSQVFYGTTGSYGSSTTLDGTLTTNHSVTVSNLNADTEYYFQVRSGDSFGVVNASEGKHFTTLLSTGNQSLAVDNVVSNYDIRSNSTILIPSYSTSQGNELLLLFVSSNGGSGEIVSSVNGGGLAWSLRSRSNGHSGTSEIWQAVAPQALSGATFTITMSQNTLTAVTLASFIGARTDLNGATAAATGASGAPGVTVNTQNNASWVWAVGNDWTNNVPRTLPAGQTLQYQLPSFTTGNTFWLQSNDNQSHVAGAPITVNDSAPTTDTWNMAAIEIVPSFSVPDTQAPSAPTDLSAAASSSTQVGLSWTASTDNVGVSGYNIFRNGTQIGTTANTSYVDNGLSPNVLYDYTVVALDAAGNTSPPSNEASVTTPADLTAPVISGVSAGNISSSSATISWTTDEPSTSQVFYGTTAAYGSSTTLDGSLVTAHSQPLTGLTSSTTYHYQVVSTDASGNSATSGDSTFTTPAIQTFGIDASVTTHQSGASSTIISSGLSTTQAGDLLVAFLTSDGPNSGGGQSFSSVSGGGLTWTLRSRSNTQAGTAEIWQAVAPSVLTNVTVTATRSSGSYVGSITVVAFKGANTAVNGATKTASAASGASTASLTTTADGSWIWAVGDDWDSATNRTVGSGQTMVDQYLAPTGDTFWVQRQTNTTPNAGTNVTINDTAPTADRWNLALIEILPAS